MITHTIEIELTPEQALTLNHLWKGYGENGGCIIFQPRSQGIVKDGHAPFTFLKGGVFTADHAQKINKAMKDQ